MTGWSDVPRRIAERREALGYTRAVLAAKSGLHERQIARYEADMPESGPDLRVIEKLAAGLGVRPAWLLYGIDVGDESLSEDALAAIRAAGMSPPDAAEAALLRSKAAASTGWTPASFVVLLQQIRLGEIAAAQHFVNPDVPRRKR